ncbi:MAG: transposase domain-containing protein [Planctomycetota bacterium]
MTENGGETGVILMSLLRTALAAGVDPQAWLREVLVRMDHERDYEKLLPAAWKLHFADELDAKRQDLIRRLAN